MLDNSFDKERLRARVEDAVKRDKNVTRITFFIVNLVLFIVFNLIGWGVVLGNPALSAMLSQANSPIATLLILPLVGWGMAVLFQFIILLLDFGLMDKNIRRRQMAGLMGEEVFQSLTKGLSGEQPEKPKRTGKVQLSDDGELISDSDAEQADTAEQKTASGGAVH